MTETFPFGGDIVWRPTPEHIRRANLSAFMRLHAIRDFDDKLLAGARPSTEEHALFRARIIRERFAADWGIGETGAAGPAGNRYGDAAGHTCIAVCGPIERAITLETGSDDRLANMRAFAVSALQLMAESLAENKRAGTR